MENIIIIAVLCLLVVFAAVKSVQHFKGQGGCCGGGTYKAKKKRLKNIISKKTFRVEGMKCGNCKARVEEAVNDIDGAAGNADLKRGELTVSYEKTVDDEVIIAKVERAGYRVRPL